MREQPCVAHPVVRLCENSGRRRGAGRSASRRMNESGGLLLCVMIARRACPISIHHAVGDRDRGLLAHEPIPRAATIQPANYPPNHPTNLPGRDAGSHAASNCDAGPDSNACP